MARAMALWRWSEVGAAAMATQKSSQCTPLPPKARMHVPRLPHCPSEAGPCVDRVGRRDGALSTCTLLALCRLLMRGGQQQQHLLPNPMASPMTQNFLLNPPSWDSRFRISLWIPPGVAEAAVAQTSACLRVLKPFCNSKPHGAG